MRAMPGEATFEQDEAVDGEGCGGEAGAALEELVDLARSAAFPAGERDVRVECAAFGLKAGRLADALDLGGESGERRLRFDRRPERAGIALLEAADAADAQLERLGADAGERGGEIFGNGALDLADEAQRQVQLLLLLPTELRAIVHRVDQQVTDLLRRANGDEQAVHGATLMHRLS